MMDQQIWQWTLTGEAIAPCFVRDVLAMRQHSKGDPDFFWLGHTPCRTVLLVGMVVGIRVFDKRTIYTIDDNTAVIDCVLRHPRLTLPAPEPRSSPRLTGGAGPRFNPKPLSPKKPRLDKAKIESLKHPPPITEPGYPVTVVGRVMRHYQSKQIYADTIDLCASSLDEIAHLERVIELHKTKYSLAVPFVPPPRRTSCIPPLHSSTSLAGTDADASILSNALPSGPSTASYTLPPPPVPIPLQNRNRPPAVCTHHNTSYHIHTHLPSSPTTSSVASSTPSSPCKPSSPTKSHEAQCKPKLRHPSRLHTRDLTGNTFRLYVKHYMDSAPPPFPILLSSPSRGTCAALTTPTKHARDEDEGDEPTPRPRSGARDEARRKDEDGPTLGFTLSHLRRVPELALLATRVVRAEARKRDKADRERRHGNSHSGVPLSSSAPISLDGSKNGTPSADPLRKKMKRLFSWAVVKLYEEGSIVLWDGDVHPLPVPPPPPVLEGVGDQKLGDNGLWKGDDTQGIGDISSHSRSYIPSTPADSSASVLYTSSASASLYSHYHAPRRPVQHVGEEHHADVDLGYVSDPGVDEEAYVPLTPRLLAGYVRGTIVALRRGRGRGLGGADTTGRETELTPRNVLTHLQRTDGRWARVGVWAVEEALAVLRTE